MTDIPEAKKTNPTFENITAECPWCGKENIFNRASDLKTFEVIASRIVKCQNTQCGKHFNISGDAINPAYEMLVIDCSDLIDQKHYMQCILSLSQAYEVFFSLFLRVELLYRPYNADPNSDWNRLDVLKVRLYQKIQRRTFVSMRNLFLRQALSGARPRTLNEAESVINNLPDSPSEPEDSEIDAITDRRPLEFLRALKVTKINELRNRVVHKDAYRPTLEEVESAWEEAKKILFPLGNHFDLYDDVAYYIGRA